MKNEIKEILDDMKIVAEHKTVGVMGQQLNFKNARILLDYITNLQEENEELKKLKERYQLEKEVYKSRNEKALMITNDLFSYSDNEEYVDNYCRKIMNELNGLNGGDE